MDEHLRNRFKQGPDCADARQNPLNFAENDSAEEGIRQRIDDFAHGRTLPAKQAFDRIRHKYNIPR